MPATGAGDVKAITPSIGGIPATKMQVLAIPCVGAMKIRVPGILFTLPAGSNCKKVGG